MDKDAEVIIFGRSGCPYTENARKLLIDKKIPYIYVEVPKVPDAAMKPCFDTIANEKGHRTVPCIFSLKYIGGFDDLSEIAS